jgi:hypothetical protein
MPAKARSRPSHVELRFDQPGKYQRRLRRNGHPTLTITTTASSESLAYPARPRVGWYVGGTGLALILLVGIPPQGRRVRTKLGIRIFLVMLIGGFVACGGSSGGGGSGSPGTAPGAYALTVTGTSVSATAAGTVTLTVQ